MIYLMLSSRFDNTRASSFAHLAPVVSSISDCHMTLIETRKRNRNDSQNSTPANIRTSTLHLLQILITELPHIKSQTTTQLLLYNDCSKVNICNREIEFEHHFRSLAKREGTYELDRLLLIPLVESRDIPGESKVRSEIDERSVRD